MRANSLRGFTLVEMLVALAITSLVMTLLMGAMYYILQVRQKLASEVHDGEDAMRTQAWFRQLVHGIVPLEADVVDTFNGDAKGFRALISPSLSVTQDAAPVPVQLRVESDAKGVSLLYQDGASPIVINTWQATSARFEYTLRSGKTTERWDPLEQTTEHAPRAIALRLEMPDGSRQMLFARVDAEPWAPKAAPKPFFMSGAGSGK
jgi:prepilin-type N-terminal cleavage/methylation domain-containing protein